jgi:hypothetical protein
MQAHLSTKVEDNGGGIFTMHIVVVEHGAG